jgi:nicotinate-nucleotide pyrophosphorylase (carboxylating)
MKVRETDLRAQQKSAVVEAEIDRSVQIALAEDCARQDATACLLDAGQTGRATVLAKSEMVVCGLEVMRRVFAQLDDTIVFTARASDGDFVSPGTTLAEVAGSTAAILAGERTALNFLGHLSGIATLTRDYAAETRGTHTRISDTRKTTPGLRVLEKYAVRTGGGLNHRMHLADAILIKDNHVRAAGSVGEAVRRAQARGPKKIRIEVEVTTLPEVEEALAAGARDLLLDNMDDDTVRSAVERVAGKALIEVSGGVTLERVARLARAGVDVISVGRITHSAPAADVSLEME